MRVICGPMKPPKKKRPRGSLQHGLPELVRGHSHGRGRRSLPNYLSSETATDTCVDDVHLAPRDHQRGGHRCHSTLRFELEVDLSGCVETALQGEGLRRPFSGSTRRLRRRGHPVTRCTEWRLDVKELAKRGHRTAGRDREKDQKTTDR